jgi:8-oxo-dGTP diphosphatase
MSLYLVRHAKAGDRHDWAGKDHLRPLSKRGRQQAGAIADALADAGIARIITSPFVRCRETVEPLAQRLGIEMETSDALVEGAGSHNALDLIEKLAGEVALLCSHGDVLGDVLRHFDRAGVLLDGDRLEKASTWVLEFKDGEGAEGGTLHRTRYVAPPTI